MRGLGFGARLGYAVWLKHLTDGAPPSNAQIGEAVGRTGQAVGAWFARTEPPPYEVHAPLTAYLGVPRDWLIDGKGAAPAPELWAVWSHARGGGVLELVPTDTPAGGRRAKPMTVTQLIALRDGPKKQKDQA